MNMRIKWILPAWMLFSFMPLLAQTELLKIRKELNALEEELKAQDHLEKSALGRAEDTERKLGLQKKLIRELEFQRNETESGIRMVSDSLSRTTESYQRIRESVAQRLVNIYKRGKYADWQVLLSVHSLNQFMVWLKYQKMIVDADERNMRLLTEKQHAMESQNKRLASEYGRLETLISEKVQEERKMNQEMDSHRAALKRIHQDRASIQEKLNKKRVAYQDIQGRIEKEEAARKNLPSPSITTGFAGMKGKLDWPVEGKVVTRHGRQGNPIDPTYILMRGIEIRAESSASVRAVSDGIVIWIHWQGWMGYFVVLDHGDGYYSVYGHLELVLVNQGERVGKGNVLGRLGDQESLIGSLLDFQVWKGSEDEDPELWLR